MTVTFEQACAIVAADLAARGSDARVMNYGFDVGDAWIPAVEWVQPDASPIGGIVTVRKTGGALVVESSSSGGDLFDRATPVGDLLDDEGSVTDDDGSSWPE